MINKKPIINIPRQCWCLVIIARCFDSIVASFDDSSGFETQERFNISSDPSIQWATPNRRNKIFYNEIEWKLLLIPSHKSELLIQSPLLQRNSSSFRSHGCVLFAIKSNNKLDISFCFLKLTKTKSSKNYFKAKTINISTIGATKIKFRLENLVHSCFLQTWNEQ